MAEVGTNSSSGSKVIHQVTFIYKDCINKKKIKKLIMLKNRSLVIRQVGKVTKSNVGHQIKNRAWSLTKNCYQPDQWSA